MKGNKMGNYLYQQLVVNWRTTLVGAIGAIAVAISSYVAAGKVTLTGMGLTAAIALLGFLFKDVNAGPLGIINSLIVKHGEEAVMEYLNAALKKQILLPILLSCLFLFLAPAVVAQTTTTPAFTVNTEAVMFCYNGTCANAGSHTSQMYDLYDPTANTHVYVGTHQWLPGDGTFQIYQAGSHLDYDPTARIKKLNLPPHSILVGADVAFGASTIAATAKTASSTKFATYLGGSFKYNFSGSVSWNTLNAGYLLWNGAHYGVLSSGLVFKFGSTSTTPVSAAKK